MAELKTKPNDTSVAQFLNQIADDTLRKDCRTLVQIMQQVTKAKPKMWGNSIVGFGSYHYRYASGHEGDSCLTGFSPRKRNLTLYIMGGFEHHEALLKKLGKHSTGGACLYIKKIDDIHLPTLRKLIQQSVKHMVKLTHNHG